jgi:hypothetical protein
MAKTKTINLAAEVRELQQRTNGIEGVTKLMRSVQLDSLAKAERLRKLVIDAVGTKKMPAYEGQIGVFIDMRKFNALQRFVKTLAPFHKAARKVRARR